MIANILMRPHPDFSVSACPFFSSSLHIDFKWLTRNNRLIITFIVVSSALPLHVLDTRVKKGEAELSTDGRGC